MRIFAISDLHLSLTESIDKPCQNQAGELYKPMSVFGQHWEKHHQKIAENWCSVVTEDDLVLIPGDHSWAITLAQACPDLDFIGQLPGKKILIKGNHDYWWEGIGKVRKILPPGMFALQNDALNFEGVSICGTRGWITSVDDDFDFDKDAKILDREVLRLQMSLEAAKRFNPTTTIAMLHYPPTSRDKETNFSQVLAEYGVRHCVYGHLHSEYGQFIEGQVGNVNYHLVSCDFLNFVPKMILEV